jgi:hypothetical protein
MSQGEGRFTGGCLCGALRYEAAGAPFHAGYCYCGDCRKASGSGFIPFMGFAADAIVFSGETRRFTSRAAHGGPSDRNFCAVCGSLVFGGVLGESASFTVYAGSLDDATLFAPQFAIFSGRRPAWVCAPEGIDAFETLPPGPPPTP